MKNSILRIPYGTRDLLAEELRSKREMESAVMGTFAAWGYDEVQTPTFEYLATFGGSEAGNSNFKFIDQDNELLMLRSDMTTPIARLVATRLQGQKKIQRLSYRAQIFRKELAQAGRQCEFTQTGIEMMGENSAVADAEIIALAIEALKQCGLRNFTICLGQVEFINGLAEASGLSEAQLSELKQVLVRRNAVELGKLSSTLRGPDAEIIGKLIYLQGDKEFLQELRAKEIGERARRALDNILDIYALLELYGVAKYIRFDLGLTRDMDYYTGMIFEGYTEGMGYPIIGGGRYDNMMAAFGTPSPATGFAIGIDRVLLALRNSAAFAHPSSGGIFVAYAEGCLPQAIATCGTLRNGGKIAKLAFRPMTEAEAREEMTAENCYECTYIVSEEK